MKRKPPAMQLYVKDALVDTSHLPGDTFKAFWVLTWKAWAGVEGMPLGHLPKDEEKLQEMSCLDRPRWLRVRDRVLGLFGRAPDSYFSKRSLEELEKLREVSEKRSESGKRGAGSRWQLPQVSQDTGMASAIPENGSSSSSALAIPESEKEGSATSRATDGKSTRGRRPVPTFPEDVLVAIPDLPGLWAERMRCARNKPTVSAEQHQVNELAEAFRKHGKGPVLAAIRAATSGAWQGLGLDRFLPKDRPAATGSGDYRPPLFDPEKDG